MPPQPEFMKKIVFVFWSCLLFSHGFSQDTKSSTTPNTNTKKPALWDRPNDHLLIQLSSDHWNGMTDSIRSHQSGFSKGFNAYFMLDKPFKATPKYSIGFGLGVSTSNMEFRRTNIGINALSATLPFTALDSTNHFKRYKLATTYLELPVEIRYSMKPSEPNKSWKVALGLKLGTLLNAHTKGKNLVDKNGNLLNSYIEKENGKRYINGTRVMSTIRVGYGIFSLFGSYQLTNILKNGTGPAMQLWQAGITLSGL